MMSNILRYMKVGAEALIAHRALFAPLLLMLIVPVAFLMSGQRFLDVSSGERERLEKDRIGTMHDLVGVAVRSGALEAGTLTPELDAFVDQNPDFESITLSRIADGTTTPVLRIGIPSDENYDDIERLASLRLDESFIFEEMRSGVRHWVGVRALTDSSGSITHLLRTDTSMERVDRALQAKLQEAYAVLMLLVAGILFLLWRQVRMIDYARLYADLGRAHSTMSLFVNMTAHELRTPLTAIRGYASMIREDVSATDGIRTEASRIETSATTLIELIGDLLDLARLQSGKMTFAAERVDVGEVALRVTTLLLPIAQKSSLGLVTDIPHDTAFTMTGDEKRITQVLTNVVSNSLKYTKEGTVTLSISRTGKRIEIRVKDTGMGIAAEDQKRLFAPYFRVATADVEKTTGTGLGMWITKRMIEEMKGTIDVESIKGVGTHIVITFPGSVEGA